ncbi:hypothetical protein DFH08DRAFT_886066 [Mycena albidolilacea]|uniref:Uncharacterized protein n=1 Tax=Mycena albidolilacea TaxID=1033008 RepID=A0AAD6ZLC1_9AGAR|nr:hypothetical protein DFH08DRAFT_886066 [Mycena albidolilacea]
MHARFYALTKTVVARPQARFARSQPISFLRTRHVLPIPRVTGLRRPYSTSNDSESFTDPGRPDLHYHLVDPPTPLSSDLPAFALSFSQAAPLKATSSTVLGWLPAATASNDHEAGLNDFRENPAFRTLLHQVIQDGLREKIDDIQINGAIQLGNGWMHIHDDRNVPALGRIGDPDDIIATVLVENGEIRPETYQAMPSYRICTSDGPTQLTPGLSQKLQVVLEARARSER